MIREIYAIVLSPPYIGQCKHNEHTQTLGEIALIGFSLRFDMEVTKYAKIYR